MKYFNYLCLFMALSLTVSCSDDDNGDGTILLTSDNLIAQSPFNYSSYELIRVVDDGGTSLTTDQLVENIRRVNSGLSYTFLTANTVRVTLGGNSGVFNYSLATSQIIITSANDFFELRDVRLFPDGRLIYESTNVDGDSMGEATLIGTFTMN